MFANPTSPNLADYLSFLYGTVGIPPRLLPSATGTATGGDVTSLIDAGQEWTNNQWAGSSVLDQSQNVLSVIARNDPITLFFSTPVPAPALAGDQYLIVPGVVATSFSVAMDTVSQMLAQASPSMYVLAVYNLAADRLINYAADQPNQTYFRDLRKDLRLMDPTMGIVASSSNESTSMSYLNPEQMKLFTLQDLETLKTPYGRKYIGIAQKVGRTVWGLS